jgi:hypothetical protein
MNDFRKKKLVGISLDVLFSILSSFQVFFFASSCFAISADSSHTQRNFIVVVGRYFYMTKTKNEKSSSRWCWDENEGSDYL